MNAEIDEPLQQNSSRLSEAKQEEESMMATRDEDQYHHITTNTPRVNSGVEEGKEEVFDLSGGKSNEDFIDEHVVLGTHGVRKTILTLQVERFRLIAYISFWLMCAFAIMVTSFTVSPNLGPCAKTEGAEPTYGLHCSVLMDYFGFNNVSFRNWHSEGSK